MPGAENPAVKQPTRRSFLKTAAAIAGGSAIRGRRVLSAEANKPRVRPNILYALSTGCWGPVSPRGKPLPLVKILDETAAGGFNGVRLTGFPGILEQNHLTVEQYGDELASRGQLGPWSRSASCGGFDV